MLDRLICHVWENPNLYYTSLFCSTYCTTATAIERYIKIVHPLWYVTSGKNKIILRLIISAWVVGSAIAIPAMFFVEIKNGRCCLVALSFEWSILVAIVDFFYIYAGPLLILLYCYCRIAYKLSTMRKSSVASPGSAFIKPDQRNPWIKDQLKNALLSTILYLQLPNFVWCGRACPSHMTQNLVTLPQRL